MTQEAPFEALLRRYRGLLFSLCRRYSRRGMDFDDLLQEASLALWRGREVLLAMPVGVQQARMVWVTARNTMIDLHRRTPTTEPLPSGYEPTVDDRSLIHELRERIALLDEPDRQLVELQLEGFSYAEIAERTGLTEKNVSVRLVRIKDRLRHDFVS